VRAGRRERERRERELLTSLLRYRPFPKMLDIQPEIGGEVVRRERGRVGVSEEERTRRNETHRSDSV